MILVHPAQVGQAAFRRLVRDRIVAPLAGTTARPLDVPDTRGLRALAIAPRVPGHTVLTGLAALWVHGWCAAPPARWHVVGARGLHRTDDARLAFHSGVTAAVGASVGGMRLAPEARACVDALRWEEAPAALTAVLMGVRDGRVDVADLRAALAQDPARGVGFARLASLVGAVCAAATPLASRP